MDQHSITSQETWLRLWRLEDQHAAVKDKLKDHEDRIEDLEDRPAPKLMSAANIKEVGMILMIGALAGSILTARDPAGALLLIEKLVSR